MNYIIFIFGEGGVIGIGFIYLFEIMKKTDKIRDINI